MSEIRRTVIVGRNSAVWRALSTDSRLNECVAIGHAEVSSFAFAPTDRVWILSYSRDMADNRRLFEALRASVAKDFLYVSTATTNVDAVTQCYSYPRVKRSSETLCRDMIGARIVWIGVVHDDPKDLPGGTTMATSRDRLAAAMAGEGLPEDGDIRLFQAETRPFSNPVERMAFIGYGALLSATGRFPCLLRPLDMVFRALNWRWYGYLYLSNRLWLTTTS